MSAAARGQAAQAEKARRKAERREVKGRESEAQTEERRINEAVTELVDTFKGSLAGTIRFAVTERTRRLKEDRDTLRAALVVARKLADDRRNELDGQVDRARAAEADAKNLRERLEQAGRDADAAHRQEAAKHNLEVERFKEIIEEQASTIKAQATALRAAEKKVKG